MPILKLCCCCCRLQTGAVVLGYIEAFLSLILLIFGFVVVGKSDSIAQSLNDMLKDSYGLQGHPRLDGTTLRIRGFGLIAGAVISLIVTIALIIGATKRNHKLITPYLVVKILSFLGVVYQYIAMLISGADILMNTLQVLIFIAISVYLWLCVFSLFQELREQPNVPREAYLMQQQPYNPQIYKPSTIPN